MQTTRQPLIQTPSWNQFFREQKHARCTLICTSPMSRQDCRPAQRLRCKVSHASTPVVFRDVKGRVSQCPIDALDVRLTYRRSTTEPRHSWCSLAGEAGNRVVHRLPSGEKPLAASIPSSPFNHGHHEARALRCDKCMTGDAWIPSMDTQMRGRRSA